MATPVERWTPAGPITSPVPSAEIEQTAARTKASAGEPGPWGAAAQENPALLKAAPWAPSAPKATASTTAHLAPVAANCATTARSGNFLAGHSPLPTAAG